MPDCDDLHGLIGDAVSDDIGRNNHQLPASVQSLSTARRMIGKRIRRGVQAHGETLGGERRKLGDVPADADKIALGANGPNNPAQI